MPLAGDAKDRTGCVFSECSTPCRTTSLNDVVDGRDRADSVNWTDGEAPIPLRSRVCGAYRWPSAPLGGIESPMLHCTSIPLPLLIREYGSSLDWTDRSLGALKV